VHNHAKKYAQTSPDAAREILQNMYVDESLTGAETDGFWLETSTGDVRDHVHSSV